MSDEMLVKNIKLSIYDLNAALLAAHDAGIVVEITKQILRRLGDEDREVLSITRAYRIKSISLSE